MKKTTTWQSQARHRQLSVVPPGSPSPYILVDFPANPNVDDEFIAPNGATYRWDGAVWIGVSTAVAPTTAVALIGSTPPPVAISGTLWWRNDPDGSLYILYDDGNSVQWVPAMPPPPVATVPVGLPDAPNDGQAYVRQNEQWVAITIP
jgi:hypothetical protein